MDLDQYILLVYKDLKGEISPAEHAELVRLRATHPDGVQLEEDIRLTWEVPSITESELESDLQQLNKRIGVNESNRESGVKVIPLWRRLPAVAAGIAVLIASVFIFQMIQRDAGTETIIASQDMKVELPDGSVVSLASGSELQYSEDFAHKRDLSLTGQAYFDVERDEMSPFTVQVGATEVRVLGTEFNVSQEGEQVTVAVTEGSVRVSNKEQSVDLAVGEVGIVNEEGGIVKVNVRTQNFNYWVNDQIRFEEYTLGEIVRELSIIFGLEIKIVEEDMRKCVLSAVFNETDGASILAKIAKKYDMTIAKDASGLLTLLDGLCK